MNKYLFSILLFCLLSISISAQGEIITVFEAVKIKNDKRAEARFYYENNWRALRLKAIKRGYIHSFEIVESKADEKADFDIGLITRFESRAQYEKVEENFRELIRERGERKLLNNLKPGDFRKGVFVKVGTSKLTTKGSVPSKNVISKQCDSAGMKFFDFLLGNWKGADGASQIKTKKILNGCGMQEFWEEKETDSDQIFLANLTRTYDQATKKWYLTFIAHDLVPQIWEGRFENGNWYFYRDWKFKGKARRSRTYWKKTSDQSFERIVEQLNDDGKTWRLHVRAIYKNFN